MKSKSQNQMSFSFEVPQASPAEQSLRALYIEQIRRDMHTLAEEADCWVPAREFYEERIASFRQAVKDLDANTRLNMGY